MTIKFLLHKDKEEKGNPSPQKQECGCPSLQPSLRSHTHTFFATLGQHEHKTVKVSTIDGAKTHK